VEEEMHGMVEWKWMEMDGNGWTGI